MRGAITRRDFVMTTLATGFAAAVEPVCADTRIVTDAKGLIAGEVRIPTADGEIPAYRALPRGGRDLPTVLVVQEIFGVHEHIKDLARRLAKAGYLALAPRCDVCGLDYRFADSGDGPAVFVILVTGFVVVGLALIVEILYSPPYWLHAALWGPLAIVLPLVLLRSFKGVLIALQFRHKAEEGKLASE